MIKKIFKKFHIMLFIPIMMIVCIFIFKEEKDNSFLLEYHEPIKWIDPKIIAHESYHIDYAREFTTDIITSNNILLKKYRLNQYLEQKRIDDEQLQLHELSTENQIISNIEINENENISSSVDYYSNTIYFTDAQINRIPYGYTQADLRMFCTMVYGECGAITGDVLITYYDEYNNATDSFYIDASYMHKLTASVLLNRCKHTSFPDTIYDNLIKKNQYNVRYTYESQAYEYYNEIGSNWYNIVNEVLDVLNGNFDIPENVIFQSNFSNLGSRYFASIYVSIGNFRSTSYYAYD